MQLCSFAGQSWHLIICEVKFARRWAHLLTACHTVQLISLPSYSLALLPFGCLPEFSGCLPAPPPACRIFSSCLPAPPASYLNFQAACLTVRLVAGPLRLPASPGRLPGLKASCLPLGLLALPGSSVATRDPIAHCCLCQYARLSCIVSRLVFSFFIRCQLLPHPHVGLALRLVQMNCF